MIRFQSRWLFFFVLILGFQVSEATTIKVCYEAWKPYIFVDDQGNMSGISHDLLSAAARDLGVKLEYIQRPFKRCVAGVRAGTMDMVLSVSRGKEGMLESSAFIAYWSLAAVVRRDSPITEPASLEMLRGKKVLLIDGYLYPRLFRQWLTNNTDISRITYGADGTGLIPFRMIEFDRADVFIEDCYWSRELIAKNHLKLQVLKPPLVVDPSVIGYRRGLARLRDQIDASFDRRGQSFRDTIFLKYLGHPESVFASQVAR